MKKAKKRAKRFLAKVFRRKTRFQRAVRSVKSLMCI
jgi:hypothetical protein